MGSLLSCLRTPTTPRLPAPPPLLSSTFPEKYDVFLSFRGEDTRNNFTSHLKAALCRTKIQTFIDDEELDRGDEISPSLLEAIEQSKLSVIIFSKNYSSSRWCLDELEKIVECKNKNGQIVIPIFYHVDPSTVRKQCGNYALFAKHWRLIFQGNMDKLQKWKAALTEATNLSGWNSMNIMSEAQLVEEVVQGILLKLNLMSPSGLDFKDLVGIDKHIEEIESLLQIGSSNIRIVGIWGMGGIGKTTIAGAVFAKLSSQFESCCFVADVQKKVKESTIDSVRDEYLSILLEEKNLRIGIPNIGTTFVNERLRRKEVLVVFDDVGDSSQLKYLLGSGDCCFGPGSRVMVTSRDRTVFVKYADEIYEVQKMNFLKSLQLFSLNAFKQDNPVEEFTELSKRMVFYCGGISLALSVLGSFLYGKSKEEWESSLKKLDETSPKKIQDVLKLSYYGLDGKEQAVFLDIACFFNKHEFMTNLIGLLGDSAIISIRSLTDLCYISIWHDGQMVEMHDLIKEMGREIVCQESIEPGKRSRLWRPKDVCQILKNNTGTDAVECISLDMSKIKELHLSATAFAKMLNLRLLKFYDYDFCNDNGSYSSKVHISEGLEIVSDRLRLFEWHGYPWRSLPLHLSMENLVELNLRFSHLEQLWDGVQHLPNLRQIDLSNSVFLTRIPDLCRAPNLKYVYLSGCSKLKEFQAVTSTNIDVLDLRMTAIEEVSPSITSLPKLISLGLGSSELLEDLPNINCKLRSKGGLDLGGCSRLEKWHPMENWRELWLDGTAIKKLPSSLELLFGLQCLNLSNCINLEFIPESICNLNSLKKLFISDCPKIVKFPHVSACLRYMKELVMDNCSSLSEIPNDIGCLSSLERLSLRGSNIVSIPASIKLLTNLGVLDMSDSKRLQSLPELPPSLVYLVASDCGSLTTVSSPRTTISDSKYLKQYRHTVRMDFTNCLDLDLCAYGNVMTEAWLALKFCLDEMLNFEVILPGSEIPKWFPYQSNGPSFTIKWIPPTWGIGHSWGFVTCVVFDVKGRIPLNKLDHKCEIEGDHFFESFPLFESCTDKFFEKDHVIMMSSYWNREGYSLPRCCSDGHHNVTFTILPQNPDRDHDTCKVKKVGIYPIKKNHREATSELCCG